MPCAPAVRLELRCVPQARLTALRRTRGGSPRACGSPCLAGRQRSRCAAEQHARLDANLYLSLGAPREPPNACPASALRSALWTVPASGLRECWVAESTVLPLVCASWCTARAGAFGRLSPSTAFACNYAFSPVPGAHEPLRRRLLRSRRVPSRNGPRPRHGPRAAVLGEATFSLWRGLRGTSPVERPCLRWLAAKVRMARGRR